MCLSERIYTYKKRSARSKEDKIMWSKGSLKIENTICHYWVKHYEDPSEDYGIDGGRISKLMIKVNGKTTLNYDRGWDIEPEDEASQLAYGILIHKYN
jgi:hypothetical protein